MIKIGIIGIGNIGSTHLDNILNGDYKDVSITAICDRDQNKIDSMEVKKKKDITFFTDVDTFLKSHLFDAVIIATPHYSHPSLSLESLKNGYHTLVEKPFGVVFNKEQTNELKKVAKEMNKSYGINFVLRELPMYKKMKQMVEKGELGELRRINWIVTDYYRTQAYYDSGTWRATWGGEGGGILLNQCPHQLDLMQWICGVPDKVRSFCYFGKKRKIEVEDDVTIFMEYKSGLTGLFVASTSDCPGTNRFELTGDKGKLIAEDGKLIFWKLSESELKYNERVTAQERSNGGVNFGMIESEKIEIVLEAEPKVLFSPLVNNWLNNIRGKEELIAEATDGVNSLLISNAAYLSTFKDSWIKIPFDGNEFEKELKVRAEQSKNKEYLNYLK